MSGSRRRPLPERAPWPVFLLDAGGRFTDANRPMERLAGLDRRALLGRPFLSLFTPESAGGERAAFDRLLEDRAAAVELRLALPGKGGPPLELEVLLERSRGPSGGILLLGSARDITELESMRRRLARSEQQAALGRIVSGVAHELNNPLTTVMGLASLVLADERLDPALAADLGKVIQETERAARIVENLLGFARAHRPERKPCRLNELVESVLALRTYEMTVSSIAVERRLAEGLPPFQGDGPLLRQAFFHLVDDAIQVLQAGGRPRRLRVETGAGDGRLWAVFEDSGTRPAGQGGGPASPSCSTPSAGTAASCAPGASRGEGSASRSSCRWSPGRRGRPAG